MSDIKLDQQQIHSEDIGEVVGDFHGTPIVQVDFEAAAEREARAQDRIAAKVREAAAQRKEEVAQ